MSLVANDDAGRRIWQGLGGLIFGQDAGSEVDLVVRNDGGRITLDARPVYQPAPPIATVGGFQITFPMVLVFMGIVIVWATRK